MNPVVKPLPRPVQAHPAQAHPGQAHAAQAQPAQAHPAHEAFILRQPTREEAEAAVRTLILWAGDDPSREGLLDTPRRVTKAFKEFYGGYAEDPHEILDRVFEEVEGYGDIVLVRDIPFYSHCEHHLVPFVGKAHIGYYPSKGVVGLSKLARVVEAYARRMQTQETMTAQIATAIEDVLRPRGVAVLIEAEHMCMSMRGVQKEGSSTMTTQFRGIFETEQAEQVKFFTMVKSPPLR